MKLHLHVHGCTIFMQDGAPCSNPVPEEKQDLCWNRPDLNPVKDMWTIMNLQGSAENLRQAIKEVWVTEIPRSTANLWYPACCVASKQLLTAKEDILNIDVIVTVRGRVQSELCFSSVVNLPLTLTVYF